MLISGKQQSGQLSNGHLENHMVHASEVLDCILLLGVFDPFCTMDTFGHLVKSWTPTQSNAFESIKQIIKIF